MRSPFNKFTARELYLCNVHNITHMHIGYRWYLDRLDETVQRACKETGSDRVILVGHSAGGWLARAYIADAKYGALDGAPNPRVAGLVTLGTPQQPPPKGCKSPHNIAVVSLHP